MPNHNDWINDQRLIAELTDIKNRYHQLNSTQSSELRLRAVRLAVALEKIEPQHTTYDQVRELVELSANAGEYKYAFGVLEGFENTQVYKQSRSTGNDIPHSALGLIGQYLDNVALNSLANTKNKRFFEHTRKTRLGRALLRYLHQGNNVIAEAIITRYPNLIHYKVNVLNEKDKTSHVENVLDLILHQAEPSDIPDNNHKSDLGLKLLHHTIRGNQLAVVAILTQYPDLLLFRGNVHDYSGREFKNVTALELALWALDVRHMAPAMLKCLTINVEGTNYIKEFVPQLLQQVEHVTEDGGGVTYTMECGLVKMSQDPTQIEMNDDTHEGIHEPLNRLLDRHDGLLVYRNKIFYYHNHWYPKTLVEITDNNALLMLQAIIDKEGKDLSSMELHLISDDLALKNIQTNVAGTQYLFKEHHYDFNPIIEALKLYDTSMKNKAWRVEEYVSFWCTNVGLELYKVPAHVAQHYCDRNMSFDPKENGIPPTFDEHVFQRTLNFDNWMSEPPTTPWWPTSNASKKGILGVNFAISRGKRENASCTINPGQHKKIGGSPCDADIDAAALTALYHKRTAEVLDLKQWLESHQTLNTEPESGIPEFT